MIHKPLLTVFNDYWFNYDFYTIPFENYKHETNWRVPSLQWLRLEETNLSRPDWCYWPLLNWELRSDRPKLRVVMVSDTFEPF